MPLAQVHHGFAPSARRRDDRVPRDLFEIGASLAVYLRKHDGNLAAFPLERTAQRHRLLSHMVAGRLLPSDVAKILTTFWNAPSEVVHQLGYDYPVLGGLNDGWKTRKAGRYRAEASAG